MPHVWLSSIIFGNYRVNSLTFCGVSHPDSRSLFNSLRLFCRTLRFAAFVFGFG